MFTVILLSDRAKARFARWGVLFEPFEESGEIAFCDWNQGSNVRSLSQAIPRLSDVIIGKRDWRVIVVDTESETSRGLHATNPENPFDYLDNSLGNRAGHRSESLNLEESKHPLVRLSHMLLGYPSMGTKSFMADPSYVDRESNQRVYESDFIRAEVSKGERVEEAAARFRAALVTERDVQTHYREIDYTEEERERHLRLAQRYQVRQSRPNEVIFIATREPIEDNPTARLKSLWGESEDLGPTRFVDRNDYPASCRFAVYDLRPKDHTAFELDELRFWLSVLSLAANDLPPSSFQADRLYRIGVELDEVTLGTTLNSHLGLLAGARESIDALVRNPIKNKDNPIAEILKQKNVRVPFDQLGGEELNVSTSGYSLASDVPKSESARWSNSILELRHRVDAFVRKPKRVLAKTVGDTRQQAESYLDDSRTLNEFERQELREELVKRTQRLTQPATPDILDRARLQTLLDQHDTSVKRLIAERMRMSTIVMASCFILVAWLGSFTPYLIQAGFTDLTILGESLLFVLVVLGIVAGVGLLVLMYMKHQLVSRIRAMNSALRSFVIGVKSSAGQFGDYLSDLATFMYGHSVLMSADKHEADDRLLRLKRAAIRKRIVERMESEKAIVLGVGQSLQIERSQHKPSEYELESLAALKQIFRLPRGQRPCALNRTGEQIAAPYDFVSRLGIEHLSLREYRIQESAPVSNGSTPGVFQVEGQDES